MEHSIDQLVDIDAVETNEWLMSLDAVSGAKGARRARYLLRRVLDRAASHGIDLPELLTTDYVNTIPTEMEPWFSGDEALERRIRRAIRWNAVAMVDRANTVHEGIGGHLSTYASAATLYEVGFNHFFRGNSNGHSDQVFYQGHAAPGIYARAYLEGRLTESDLDRFRREVSPGGLPSYPHPRRSSMWEFPTVSMGLGSINAIQQARFNRYLAHRQLVDTTASRVWCFLGDGELDEPESIAGLSLAARERLDNLTFVVNCNLQRLDGPVRGNGKVIQELESIFHGMGWSVIKVVWGREWDELLAKDSDHVLVNKMNTTVDGEFQKFAVESGSYIRDHFFGPDPRLQRLVEHLPDDALRRLSRGGHDYRKVFAAYARAVAHRGRPTVILAKTVKGWTLGDQVEARNATHQIKKLTRKQRQLLRDRLEISIPDETLDSDLMPYFHPGEGSDEVEYLRERRRLLGGSVPSRRPRSPEPTEPLTDIVAPFAVGTPSGAQASTTGAFTRLLRILLKDPDVGSLMVPIIPDEGRTFGMDGLFSEFKIYSPVGQLYDPVDGDLAFAYREAKDGQILEEGISEAAAMGAFTAAGTAAATWQVPTIPFFIHYSMFGFQRVGDAIWAFADQLGRGFLLGATAGRTTLSGEGLQHCDGQSHLYALAYPNCRAYDPAFAYEVAVIIRDGLSRMFGTSTEDCFYYLTLYNESYVQPAMPAGVEDGIVRGMYVYRPSPIRSNQQVRLLASGPMVVQALKAQELLANECGVASDVWSITSWKALHDDAVACESWNRDHVAERARRSYLEQELAKGAGPVIAVSDWVRAVPGALGRYISNPFHVLGTDGFGLSDERKQLRAHFGVDATHIATTAVFELERGGWCKGKKASSARAAIHNAAAQ